MASYAAATIGATSGSSPLVTPVIDANHPYYLQTTDNPCTPIVTQLLSDQNYYHWS